MSFFNDHSPALIHVNPMNHLQSSSVPFRHYGQGSHVTRYGSLQAAGETHQDQAARGRHEAWRIGEGGRLNWNIGNLSGYIWIIWLIFFNMVNTPWLILFNIIWYSEW